MWYLDDGTLGGNADTVFSDFQKIIQAENRLGLSINQGCQVFCSRIPNFQQLDIKIKSEIPKFLWFLLAI